MADHRSEDLIQVGLDGFAILDEYLGRRSAKPYTPQKSRRPQNPQPMMQRNQPAACYYTYQPQQSHVYYATPVSSTQLKVVKGSTHDF
ncbi:hypothetical protein ACS0TY_027291 [Phlomoides rotata]